MVSVNVDECLMVSSDVGFLPIFFLSGRFPRRRRDGGRRRVRRRVKPSGVDRPGDSPQETQTVFQVPDSRIGKGIPVQRLRVQTKTVGTCPQFESDRTSGQDMVPEQKNEEQEEQPATSGATAEQQQQQRQ